MEDFRWVTEWTRWSQAYLQKLKKSNKQNGGLKVNQGEYRQNTKQLIELNPSHWIVQHERLLLRPSKFNLHPSKKKLNYCFMQLCSLSHYPCPQGTQTSPDLVKLVNWHILSSRMMSNSISLGKSDNRHNSGLLILHPH